MTEKNRASRIGIVSAVSLGCVLLGVMWLPALTRAEPLSLPPLNTQTPYPTGQATPVSTATPQATATSAPAPPAPPTGGLVNLRVQFPEWLSYQWQELWTVVQWQDEWGTWHDVEGWQGTLDHVTTSENGEIVGKGTWWVAKDGLGTGPFRWQVYRSEGGRVLVTSDEFDLPGATGQAVTVEVALGP